MPINAGPEYLNAEKKYLDSKQIDDKIFWLEEMIKTAPKHKSSEKFLSELKRRLKKLQNSKEKASKKSSGKKGIKKIGFQFVLIGFPNSGKSSLLAKLTNASPIIAQYAFSTTHPEIGTFDFQGIKAQIIDIPAFGSENFDSSIVNTADALLLVLESLQDMSALTEKLERATKNRIILINKSDLLSEIELRKLYATIKSKRLNALPISTVTNLNIEELKEKMFSVMKIIRVFTKEPGKPGTKEPIVLPQNSTVKDIAEKILKGFSKKVKETHLTGPSSKFPNQRVGLSHVLRDLDIVEFHT